LNTINLCIQKEIKFLINMIDTFNIIGLSNLFLSSLTFYLIVKKFGISNYVILAWFGLFIYSIPVFINLTRKIYYTEYDVEYLINPPIESKLIYFVFWIGFLISILIYNKKYFDSFKLNRENIQLDVFEGICLIYIFLYFLTFAFPQFQFQFISLIAKWLFLFLSIIFVLRKKYINFILLIIALIFYSISVPDRTLITITILAVFVILISQFKFKLTLNRSIFLITIVFILLFLLLFNKLIYNIIFYNQNFHFNEFIESFKNLKKSFEPSLILTHSILALDIDNFDTFSYLKSILSNFYIFPGYFGISNNYYYENLISNIPFELNYGLGGSLFASSFLAFGYPGLALIGFLFGVVIIKLDNFSKINKSNLKILSISVLSLMAVYIYRNSLDNFLSFIKQIVLLYIFIQIQVIFLLIFIKKSFKYENFTHNK
jgi:hypothetical protein